MFRCLSYSRRLASGAVVNSGVCESPILRSARGGRLAGWEARTEFRCFETPAVQTPQHEEARGGHLLDRVTLDWNAGVARHSASVPAAAGVAPSVLSFPLARESRAVGDSRVRGNDRKSRGGHHA